MTQGRTESVSFDRAAEYYDQTRGFPPGIERGVVETMAQAGELSQQSQVLEIGIGTGRIALPMAQYVGAYYGIDISPAMVSRLVAKRTGERVLPVLGDATRLPFPDHAFDAVIAVHIFHLLPYEAALKEVARVLKPGGYLLHGWGAVVSFPELTEAWNTANGGQYRMRSSLPWGTDEGYIERAGWHKAKPDQFHRYTEYRAPQDYADMLRKRLWSQTWTMPDDTLQRGIAAVQEQIDALYPNPTEPLPIEQAFRVEVWGWVQS